MSASSLVLDAERSLVGAVLLDRAVLGYVGQLVSSEDFGDATCRLVFEAATCLDATGTAIDFVTVGQALEERGQLARCGGTAFLVELAQATTTTAHAAHHARIVGVEGRRRRALERLRTSADALERERAEDVPTVLEGLEPPLAASRLGSPDTASPPFAWPTSSPSPSAGSGRTGSRWGSSRCSSGIRTSASPPSPSTWRLGSAEAAWPDGPGALAPGRVLIATAEDGLEDTIRPRAVAAGADLERVEAIQAVRTPDGPRPLSLELDLARLESKVARTEDLRLLLIDPLSAFLGSTESHRDTDVRRVLGPVAALAERHGVAVVGILHLNKGQSKALYRAMGSVAFVAAARAVWSVARDPENQERRFLVPVKHNLGTAPALAFALDEAPGPAGTTVPRIAWEAQPVAVTADEVLGPPADFEPESDRGRARTWLLEALASGPLAARTVLAQAEENGISKRTLDRAKKDLEVRSFKRAAEGPWFWRLPEDRQASIPEKLATFGAPGDLRPGEAKNGHPSAEGDPADCEDRQEVGVALFGAEVPLVLAPGSTGMGRGREDLP